LFASFQFKMRVTSTAGTNSVELSGRSRFFAAVVGVGLLGLLILAGQLRPNPRGFGTHEQLGLPPCTFSLLAGVRCPACGMTTSWSLLTNGRPIEALENHVTGVLLAGLTLAVGMLALVVAVRGKRIDWYRYEVPIAVAATILAGLVLGEWLIRILAS